MKRLNEQLWLLKEAKHYVVGITKELQCDAGDISYAQIAPLGAIEIDDTLLNVEASKAAIEVPSAFNGVVIARNEQAEVDPTLLDSKDAQHHWVVKVTGIEDAYYEALPPL